MIFIKDVNIMLIGCGPHAKRIYIPFLMNNSFEYKANIKVIVELEDKKDDIINFLKDNDYLSNVNYVFVKKSKNKYLLSSTDEKTLNNMVEKNKINGVIIATDPLNHMKYVLWAEKLKLHILMDKPISTYDNIISSVVSARRLKNDYDMLIKRYDFSKAFIINAQRRFLPQFEIVQEKVNEIAEKYGMPVTSMQSTHSDGQWRLPNEILSIKYHPLLGWGKVSHSGYHFIDMAIKIVKDSYCSAKKDFEKMSVYSKFIYPSGILKMQSQNDLKKIFGEEYEEIDSRTDKELIKMYKKYSEAEVDATSLINLSLNGSYLTNITLNLLHNGFSRRSWLNANYKDLYKGNGRVRHEYHNIQQGCLQNIQIHSYQSNDKSDASLNNDFKIGGNNHYDIYIFRNVGIIGGQPFEKITGEEVSKKYFLNKEKLMNELARNEAIKQFIEIIVGEREALKAKSNLLDHNLSVQLMSMIYESAIKKKEIIQDCR